MKIETIDIIRFQEAVVMNSSYYTDKCRQDIINRKGAEYLVEVEKAFWRIIDKRLRVHRILYGAK